MDLDLDDNSTSNSSDDVTLDGAITQPGNEQDVVADGAESSDAQGDNATQDDGTAGIVRDVVAQRQGQATASPAEGQEQKDQEGKDKPGDEDDEDYSDVPFNKHPRFQHLLRAKKTSEQDAGRYRNVQKFMDDNGIEAAEAANAYTFMAAIKQGRYTEAWEMIKPTVQHLLVAAGEVVPDDLKQDVAAGAITQERAQELARERAKGKSLEQGRTFDQQMRERNDAATGSQQLHTAAVDWARDRAKKDPQFEAKQPPLMKEVAWLMSQSRGKEGFDQHGRPKTPDGVKKQLEEAYKAVTVPAARVVPGGKPVPKVGDGTARPRLVPAGGPSGTNRPQPLTTLDIIRAEKAKRLAAG